MNAIFQVPKMDWNVYCDDGNVLIYVRHSDTRTYFLTNMFFDEDIFSLMQIISNENYQPIWNFYLKKLKILEKYDENLSIYRADFEFNLKEKVHRFTQEYIRHFWIRDDKFILIKQPHLEEH